MQSEKDENTTDGGRLHEMQFLLAALEKQIASLKRSPELASQTLSEIIGESYFQELEKLTDAEAGQYLKSVDDSRLVEAYSVLEKKLSDSVLIEIFLDYLKRPTHASRLMGTSMIGVYLFGTRHKEASHLLALIIHDQQETVGIRRLAYSALKQINSNESMLDHLYQSASIDIQAELSSLDDIDLDFVDSFL